MVVCGQIHVILGVLDMEKFENHIFEFEYLEDRTRVKVIHFHFHFNIKVPHPTCRSC